MRTVRPCDRDQDVVRPGPTDELLDLSWLGGLEQDHTAAASPDGLTEEIAQFAVETCGNEDGAAAGQGPQ